MPEQPTAVEELTADFLAAAHRNTAAAFDKTAPREEFPFRCALAQAYGLLAYVLDAFHQTGEDSAELACELADFIGDGEPLADWVSRQLHARGIDADVHPDVDRALRKMFRP